MPRRGASGDASGQAAPEPPARRALSWRQPSKLAFVRVAIIGAGWIAAEHAATIGRLDDVELAGVCDIDEGRARELAGGAAVYTDWHELLVQAHRSYVADVDALLEGRRHLFETIAALRRVAVAAEAALFESRAGQQGKRLEALLRALEMAGYGQQENAAAQITARTSG